MVSTGGIYVSLTYDFWFIKVAFGKRKGVCVVKRVIGKG